MSRAVNVTIDELDIPILICNNNGEIVYKNILAKKKIRSPRLNSNIRNFIYKQHKPLYNDVCNFGKNEIIKITTNSDFTTALVCPYKRDGAMHSIWIFCCQLQFLGSTEFYHEIKNAILQAAPKIIKLISKVDHENECKDDKEVTLAHRIAEESGKFSLNVCSPKISLTMFSVDGIINIIKKCSDAVFAKFGYVLKVAEPFVDSSDIYINNYKPFIFTYLSAINTVLNVADKNRAKLFTYYENNQLYFDITFNIPDEITEGLDYKDYLLNDVVTKSKVNIYLFVHIFNALGYKSELYKNDYGGDTYTYRLVIPNPVNRKLSLRSKDYSLENEAMLMEILEYSENITSLKTKKPRESKNKSRKDGNQNE